MRSRTALSRAMIAHRERRLLSQLDLAKRSGLSVRAIEAWEEGDRVPQPTSLRRWSKALHLSATERSEVGELAARSRERLAAARRRRRRAQRLPVDVAASLAASSVVLAAAWEAVPL